MDGKKCSEIVKIEHNKTGRNRGLNRFESKYFPVFWMKMQTQTHTKKCSQNEMNYEFSIGLQLKL